MQVILEFSITFPMHFAIVRLPTVFLIKLALARSQCCNRRNSNHNDTIFNPEEL